MQTKLIKSFDELRDDENALSAQLQAHLRYEKRAAFWGAVYREGIPHIRVSDKRILFPVGAVREWLTRRTVGKVAR